MCGIVGIFDTKKTFSADDLRLRINRMTQTLRHRGPDAEGVWLDNRLPLALGHRRLSVLDLSDAGQQPMVSASGRYIIVYNGEIYNHQQVKTELLQQNVRVKWRGHSDTEILLEAVEHWGIHNAVTRLNGMFAFAVWDQKDRVLHMVRDRIGKKPLYYGWQDGLFVFSSELKAIRAGIGIFEVNRNALPFLLRQNFIPSPHSIISGIYKLPPACIVSFPLEYLETHRNFSPFPRRECVVGIPYYYWYLKDLIYDACKNNLFANTTSILEKIEEILMDAVKLRMVADVPIGAFLSGGIDSSLVTAFMQAQSSVPIKTFSIGYNEKGNEAEFAKRVADYLGTEHTELYISPEMLLEQIQNLPTISDEPIGDTAVIPTFFVSRLARQAVTVVLSGDGGDELFAGYPRYIWAKDYWCRAYDRVRWMPTLLRKIFTRGVREIPVSFLKKLPYGHELLDLSTTLQLRTPEEVYHYSIDHWRGNLSPVVGSEPMWSVMSDPSDWPKEMDPIQRMVYLDLAGRLPDSIVSKVDRASMQVSLEVRCPILDYRMVEMAMRIPTDLKIRNGNGKWILRQLLHRYVPKELVDRTKIGFKMPICNWLKGPLLDWAEALLDENRIRREGYFQPQTIGKKWQEHLSGQKEWHYDLWNVLMFQSWLDHYKD